MELRGCALLYELSRRRHGRGGRRGAVLQPVPRSPCSSPSSSARRARSSSAGGQGRCSSHAAGCAWPITPPKPYPPTRPSGPKYAERSGAPRGRVRLTSSRRPRSRCWGAALDTLRDRAPDLRVEVLDSETAPALDALRSRAVDVVVGESSMKPIPGPDHRDVDRGDLIEEDVLLAVPVGEPARHAGGPIGARRRRARRPGGPVCRLRPQRRRRAPVQPARRLCAPTFATGPTTA